MWDYETDAPRMWPREAAVPDATTRCARCSTAIPKTRRSRGKWGDPEFLKNVSELNPKLKDTQFADYHGHGWNFRAVYKRDRKGNLLDADGKLRRATTIRRSSRRPCTCRHPRRRRHALRGLPLRAGHHGNGHIYGEVAAGGRDRLQGLPRHGDAVSDAAHLRARRRGRGGTDLSLLRTPDGAAPLRVAAAASSTSARCSTRSSSGSVAWSRTR